MLADYGYIGLFLLVVILFAVSMPLIPLTLRFFGLVRHKPNPMKSSTYECGMETVGRSWVQFNLRYYFYALLFVAFDILTVFLYPWAVNLKWLDHSTAIFGLVAVVTFLFILSIGYIYAWKKGFLEWK